MSVVTKRQKTALGPWQRARFTKPAPRGFWGRKKQMINHPNRSRALNRYIGKINRQADEINREVQIREVESHMFEVRHDIHGFYVCTFLEAEYEDEGNPSVGFDGRAHYETIEQATQSLD
jgi:hypothetical protein